MTSFFFFVFGVLSTFLLRATLWFSTLSLLGLIITLDFSKGLVRAGTRVRVGSKVRVRDS